VLSPALKEEKVMNRFIAIVDSTNDWIGRIWSILIWPGVVVILWEVISRYFFDAPTLWAYGVAQRIFAAYFIIGGAYCVLRRAHIRIDIIYNLFKPGSKMLAIIELGIYPLCLFAISAVILYFGIEFAWDSLSILEVDNSPFHAPLYPVKVMIPLAGLLLMLEGVAELVRSYRSWKKRETFVSAGKVA